MIPVEVVIAAKCGHYGTSHTYICLGPAIVCAGLRELASYLHDLVH